MSVKLRDLGGTIESNWQENASATALIALSDLHIRCSLLLFTRTSLISRNDPPNPRYHDGVYVPSFFLLRAPIPPIWRVIPVPCMRAKAQWLTVHQSPKVFEKWPQMPWICPNVVLSTVASELENHQRWVLFKAPAATLSPEMV